MTSPAELRCCSKLGDYYATVLADCNEVTQRDPNYSVDIYVLRVRRLAEISATAPRRPTIFRTPSSSIRNRPMRTLGVPKSRRRTRASSTTRLADFDEALRLDPQHAKAYALRGDVRRHKGPDSNRRLKDFDEAIRLDSKAAFTYCRLRGQLYGNCSTTRYGALADFDEAIRLDPKYALGYAVRGSLHAGARSLRAGNDWP